MPFVYLLPVAVCHYSGKVRAPDRGRGPQSLKCLLSEPSGETAHPSDTTERLYCRARGKASIMAIPLPRVSGGFLWWIPGRGSILKSHHVGHGCPCPFMAGSGGHNPR